eukprot:427061_1
MAYFSLAVYMLSVLMNNGLSTDLNASYSSDITLTMTDSPYYVVSNVEIQSSATMYIENGIELIFLDDYVMDVYGVLDGCYSFDTTSITNIVGLANNETFTHIFSDHVNQTRIGQIFINANSYGFIKMCNTLFTDINSAAGAHVNARNGRFQIDNCEISDCYYGTYDVNEYLLSHINDTYIHNVEYINYGRATVYEHCRLDTFVDFGSHNGQDIIVRNCVINGNGADKCIRASIDERQNPEIAQRIYNNTIMNCAYGIYFYNTDPSWNQVPPYTIEYNTIINCTQGIHEAQANATIQYNTIVGGKYGLYDCHPTIRYNAFYNINSGADIYVFDMDNVFIEGNSFYFSQRFSISTRGPTITIINNTFMNGTCAAYIWMESHAVYAATIQRNAFLNLNGNDNQNVHYVIYGNYLPESAERNAYYVENNEFIGNTLKLNVILFSGGGNIHVKNNVFKYNNLTYQPGQTSIINIQSQRSSGGKNRSYVMNNLFTQNTMPSVYKWVCAAGDTYEGKCGENTVFSYNNVSNNYLLPATTAYAWHQDNINLLTFEGAYDITVEHNILHNNMHQHVSGASNNYIYIRDVLHAVIQYNTFLEYKPIESYIYVLSTLNETHTATGYDKMIQYNNFFDPMHNVLYFVSLYAYFELYLHANFNYFNGQDISPKLRDKCDYFREGYIVFWPYFTEPIDYSNIADASSISNVTTGFCSTFLPTTSPTTGAPTAFTSVPSMAPTRVPSIFTLSPSDAPTIGPTLDPTLNPTAIPTSIPTMNPSSDPTAHPSVGPTTSTPTVQPTVSPTVHPTVNPTQQAITSTDIIIDETVETTPSVGGACASSIVYIVCLFVLFVQFGLFF